MRYIDADKMLEVFKELHGRENDLLNCYNAVWIESFIEDYPTADVQKVRHGRCNVCSGKVMLMQDGYTCNGYYIEIDAEQQELAVWEGDECLAVFPIDYCPKCGAKLSRKE